MEKRIEIKHAIGVFDNFLDEKICDGLIKNFEENVKLKKAFDRQTGEDAPKSQKDDLSVTYFKGESWIKEIEFLTQSVRECLEIYLKNTGFAEYAGLKELHFTNMKVQKTFPGGGYHIWHIEKNYNEFCKRALVFTIYLNDIEDGGETEFLFQNMRVSPKKGRICFFPAGFPYVHRGNPPLQKVKYILTSWLNS
jgi:hypothetical protein